MVGPPCTGKSYLAKRMARENNHMIRVNLDDLRTMLNGKYVFNNRVVENTASMIQRTVVEYALANEHDVIVDATHLKEKWIKKTLDVIPEGSHHQVEYLVCEAPYWKQRWRNFWRWLKTGIWIPSEVAKNMNTNFSVMKQKIDNKQI